MKFQQWPKRDPNKNNFKIPNEVFYIGLSYPEITIYCYLLSIEDRETYQCYPSYKTIGEAVGTPTRWATGRISPPSLWAAGSSSPVINSWRGSTNRWPKRRKYFNGYFKDSVVFVCVAKGGMINGKETSKRQG